MSHPQTLDYAGAATPVRCLGCWNTGLRTLYGAGGAPISQQYCPCGCGEYLLLSRVLEGLRALPASGDGSRPARRAPADQAAEERAAALRALHPDAAAGRVRAGRPGPPAQLNDRAARRIAPTGS